MRITFIGVGEAFDELEDNTSLWLETDDFSALLDCGFTVAHALFRRIDSTVALDMDALYVTHFHGDHSFGIPALLLRLWDAGRKKPLIVMGGGPVQEKVETLMRLAYPNLLEKLGFQLQFVDISGLRPVNVGGTVWRFAQSEHGEPNYSVRVEAAGASVFLSGDGRPTEATKDIARDVDLMVHEAYTLGGEIVGHGTIQGCIETAREVGVKRLALVHVNREDRRGRREEIDDLMKSAADIDVFLPASGDVVDISA